MFSRIPWIWAVERNLTFCIRISKSQGYFHHRTAAPRSNTVSLNFWLFFVSINVASRGSRFNKPDYYRAQFYFVLLLKKPIHGAKFSYRRIWYRTSTGTTGRKHTLRQRFEGFCRTPTYARITKAREPSRKHAWNCRKSCMGWEVGMCVHFFRDWIRAPTMTLFIKLTQQLRFEVPYLDRVQYTRKLRFYISSVIILVLVVREEELVESNTRGRLRLRSGSLTVMYGSGTQFCELFCSQ